MALPPGTRLGVYEIGAQIGAGGMGEVYRATDTGLGRAVAIKVLPEALADDPDRLARFQREAEVLASLNHPGIAAIYGLEASGPTKALVMELVEGPTLSERIDRGPVALDEALPIARQIAEALEAAHEQGIIHRDLKPANIKVRDDGVVKVLDFGLAKALAPDSASATGDHLANSPTLTARATEVGTILGTAAYMAPEQARGRAVDRRADIWAFGAVLFEMLTGRRAFDGADVADVLAAVVRDAPPFELLPGNTPEPIRRLLRRCLEKDRSRRLDSMRAVQLEVADAISGSAEGGTTSGPAHATPARRRSGLGVAAGLLAGALAGAALWAWLGPPADERTQPPSRLAVLVPNFGGASTALLRQIGLTPDGQTLLFSGIAEDGQNRTMRLDLDQTEPVVVPGVVPFLSSYVISRDGTEFVGFEVGSYQMYRYALSGGSARPFPRDVNASSYTVWAGDGAIWISADSDPERGIVRVDAAGEVTKPLGTGHAQDKLMQILPGDRAALVIRVGTGSASGPAMLIDLTTGTTTMLLDTDIVEIRYTPGYLVYVQPNGTLHAVSFDLDRLAVAGEPLQIAEGVSLPGTGVGQFAVSDNGTVAYVPEEPRSLVFVDRQGRSRQATTEKRNFHAPTFSPDGRRVATDFDSPDGRDVWTLDVGSGLLTRATFDRDGHDAQWTPDGRSISYTTVSDNVLTLRRTRPGSAEPAEVLFASPQLAYSGLWLADSSALVTVANALVANSQTDIGLLRDGGQGPLDPIVATRFVEQHPAVSPDDRWLAFASNQSGQDQVFVRPLGRDGDVVQVSVTGGIEPVWGPDGKELFYRSGAGGASQLMAADIATSPGLAVSSRRALFPVGDIATATPHGNYDISPDGKTFVMVRYNPATRIMVIQNLPALVAKLTGSDR